MGKYWLCDMCFHSVMECDNFREYEQNVSEDSHSCSGYKYDAEIERRNRERKEAKNDNNKTKTAL